MSVYRQEPGLLGLAGNTKEEFSKLSINTGQPLDMLLFNKDEPEWRTRRTVPEAVYLYDGAGRRTVIKDGLLVE